MKILFFIIILLMDTIAAIWLLILFKITIGIAFNEIKESVDKIRYFITKHKKKKEDSSYYINQFKKYICKVIEYNRFHLDSEPDLISFEPGEYILKVEISLAVCDDMKERFDKLQDDFYDKGYGSYFGQREIDEQGILHTFIILTTGEKQKYRIWN